MSDRGIPTVKGQEGQATRYLCDEPEPGFTQKEVIGEGGNSDVAH